MLILSNEKVLLDLSDARAETFIRGVVYLSDVNEGNATNVITESVSYLVENALWQDSFLNLPKLLPAYLYSISTILNHREHVKGLKGVRKLSPELILEYVGVLLEGLVSVHSGGRHHVYNVIKDSVNAGRHDEFVSDLEDYIAAGRKMKIMLNKSQNKKLSNFFQTKTNKTKFDAVELRELFLSIKLVPESCVDRYLKSNRCRVMIQRLRDHYNASHPVPKFFI